MNGPSINRIGEILTLIKPTGRTLALIVGDTVRAEILNVLQKGDVSVRIGKEVIRASAPNIPLSKGDEVLLKVIGLEKDIMLQFLGFAEKGRPQKAGMPYINENTEIPPKILKLFSKLSDARMKSSDIKLLTDMFRSVPEDIRLSFPEFKAVRDVLPDIRYINSQILKTSIEDSGILFETKLKIAATALLQAEQKIISDIDETETTEYQRGSVLKSGEDIKDTMVRAEERRIAGDFKELLLKVKEALKNESVYESIKLSGIKIEDAAKAVDRLIRNIEFFQIASRMNEVLYTFLPVFWYELRDGELIFKKSKDAQNCGDLYQCILNLNHGVLGKISISVIMYEGVFYVSFRVEDAMAHSLLRSKKALLEKRFMDAGMALRAVNFSVEPVTFGEFGGEGLHIRI